MTILPEKHKQQLFCTSYIGCTKRYLTRVHTKKRRTSRRFTALYKEDAQMD